MVVWIHITPQGPRQCLVVAAGAPLGESLKALRGARVVCLAARHAREDCIDVIEKLLALRPRPAGDDHLGGNAIERGVVHDRRGHILRLKPQLAVAVLARYDDPRRDIAQFASNRLL